MMDRAQILQSSWYRATLDVAFGAHGALSVLSGVFLIVGFVWFLTHGIFDVQGLVVLALMWTLFLPGILIIVATVSSLLHWKALLLTGCLALFVVGLENEEIVLMLMGIGVSFWEGQPRQPQEAPKGACDELFPWPLSRYSIVEGDGERSLSRAEALSKQAFGQGGA